MVSSVTASFYVHHQDQSGEVSRSHRVSCVDITEELLSMSLGRIHEMAHNALGILNQLQSFALERAQYEAISHYSIALDDPSAVLRLFGIQGHGPGLTRLLDLVQPELDKVRAAHGFVPRQFDVQVAQVRRCVRVVSVMATNQFEAGERAIELAKTQVIDFLHEDEEFFVDEVLDPVGCDCKAEAIEGQGNLGLQTHTRDLFAA